MDKVGEGKGSSVEIQTGKNVSEPWASEELILNCCDYEYGLENAGKNEEGDGDSQCKCEQGAIAEISLVGI